jgi:hypothetical protein
MAEHVARDVCEPVPHRQCVFLHHPQAPAHLLPL